jgi:hypothetical protein
MMFSRPLSEMTTLLAKRMFPLDSGYTVACGSGMLFFILSGPDAAPLGGGFRQERSHRFVVRQGRPEQRTDNRRY